MNSERFTRKHFLLAVVVVALASIQASWAQTETVLHSFKGGNDSGKPYSGLIADAAGNLYGTTSGFNFGCGSVFRLHPSTTSGIWLEDVLYTFSCQNEGTPYASLIMDQAGNLFGTTFFNSLGTVFELSPPSSPGGAWTETVLHTFSGGRTDGGGPVASLAMDDTGNLYGTTENGGRTDPGCSSNGCGTVFELSPPTSSGAAWTESIIHFFSDTSGNVPAAGVTLANDGSLFGTTFYGGSADMGVVFQLSPPQIAGGAWTGKLLYSFTDPNEAHPYGNLIFDTNGNLFGTTSGTLNVGGTVFELSPSAQGGWLKSTLHAFSGTPDGSAPAASVTFDSFGNLYGTTIAGGATNWGTVFELTPPSGSARNWTETLLYSFSARSNGGFPVSSVIIGSDGAVYGTTELGGVNNPACGTFGCGTVFRLTIP